MATPSNNFSYMYQVQLQNDGSFVLKDFDNSTSDGITPIGTGIAVSDNISDPVAGPGAGNDNPELLGDAIKDEFTLTAQGSL